LWEGVSKRRHGRAMLSRAARKGTWHARIAD
jgi:hypothetical protein